VFSPHQLREKDGGEGAIFTESGVVVASMTRGLIQVDDDLESETDVLGTLPQSGNRYEPE
jgi:hypothetical protein